MIDFVYYNDTRYPDMQWRYPRRGGLEWARADGQLPEIVSADSLYVSNVGEVRLDGGPWITATTTLADQISDKVQEMREYR